MKKFLSLVLALVMTMSLVTIGAGAADFSDDDSIDYGEAIDVMNAIGVVTGYSDGSFRPDAVLTRGAASKIICNMLLGTTTANALSVNTAPFSDVAADSTFAGYIAYMVKQGIVSGYADGTFRPGANLTGYAFMKMLLTALGYDAKKEGYVGANWSVAVAKQALAIGLDGDLEDAFNGLKPVTRQEACLYAFNALQSPMVYYGSETNYQSNDGSSFNISGTLTNKPYSASTVPQSSRGNINKLHDPLVVTSDQTAYLGEQVYPDLELIPTTDAFGRPATKWENNGDEIGTYKDTAKVTFTEATKASGVAAALKNYRFKDAAGNAYSVSDSGTNQIGNATNVWYAMSKDTNSSVWKGSLSKYKALSDSSAGVIAKLTKNNAVVEVYAGSNKVITDVVAIWYTVAEVTDVITNSKGDVKYIFDNAKDGVGEGRNPGVLMDYASETKTDDVVVHGKVSKGDFVTYAMGNDDKIHVWPTTAVKGTISDTDTDDETVTMSGTTYTAWTVTGLKAGKEATLYIDQHGNVAYTDATETSKVAILAGFWRKDGYKDLYYGQLVHADGTVEEVQLFDDYKATHRDRAVYISSWDGAKAKLALADYASGKNVYWTDDDVTLTAKSSTLSKSGAAAKYYLGDDTKFVYVDDYGDDLKVSVVTGPHKATLKGTLYVVMDDATKENVETVFVVGQRAKGAGADMLFLADPAAWGTMKDKKGDGTFWQKFYVDGEEQKIQVDAVPSEGAGFYTYSIDEATGNYALTYATDMDGVAYAYGLSKDGGVVGRAYTGIIGNGRWLKMGNIGASDKECYYDTKGAAFYDLSSAKSGGVDSLASILKSDKATTAKKMLNVTVFAIVSDIATKDDEEEALTIYVIDSKDAPKKAWLQDVTT